MNSKVKSRLRRKLALAILVILALSVGLAQYPGVAWRDVAHVVLASIIFVALLAIPGMLVGFVLQLVNRTRRK